MHSMPGTRGWSLVELVMVIMIVGILAAFVGPVLLNAVGAYERTQQTVNTYAKMRYAMERIAREVAAVRRDPANTTAFNVTTMTAANFTFTKEDGTEVAITTAGGNINLAYVGTATGVLTDRVSALNFVYFRQDGATAAGNATNLAFVEVAMTITDGANSFANRVRIALRTPQ